MKYDEGQLRTDVTAFFFGRGGGKNFSGYGFVRGYLIERNNLWRWKGTIAHI